MVDFSEWHRAGKTPVLSHYHVKKGRIMGCTFDCYLWNSLLDNTAAERTKALRHDDGTYGTYYFISCFHSCSHRENCIREMENLTHCCLQEHSSPSYRDGFIQGLGLELLKVLAKRITQIPRQMHLEQPFVQDNLQYSSQAILPYLSESCPLPSGYTAPGVLVSYIPTNICSPFRQSLILRSLGFV